MTTGVLVLGSAPTVARGPYPDGLARWCVNGSIGLLGHCDTHVVLGKMLNTDTAARIQTRQQLHAARSITLIVAYQDVAMPEVIGYTTTRREFLSSACCARVQIDAGAAEEDTQRERTTSTGLLAVCLALTRQLGPVVVSGFSFNAKGHYYDRKAGTSWHRDVDRPVWEALMRRWPGRLSYLGVPLETRGAHGRPPLTLPAWTSA